MVMLNCQRVNNDSWGWTPGAPKGVEPQVAGLCPWGSRRSPGHVMWIIRYVVIEHGKWWETMGNQNFLSEASWIPSGELTFCHGKSPFLMGKSTINGPFSIAMLVHQRVTYWSFGPLPGSITGEEMVPVSHKKLVVPSACGSWDLKAAWRNDK